MDFDMEILISAVENRPVLWDKTTENYKNKQLNFAAWREICVILHEDFESLSDKEKNDFGKEVTKKWSNARDNWMRCAKKLKEMKSGSEAKTTSKYKFFEQMQFLHKIVSHRPTGTNMPPTEPSEKPPVRDDSAVQKKRRKTETADEILATKIHEMLDSSNREDSSPVMCFFRGIAPTVEKFSDAEFINFQFEVISSIRNIQQRNILMAQHIPQPQSYQPQPQSYQPQPHSYQPQPQNYQLQNFERSTPYQTQPYLFQHNRNLRTFDPYPPSTSTANFSQVSEPQTPAPESSPSFVEQASISDQSSVSQSDVDFDFAKSPTFHQ